MRAGKNGKRKISASRSVAIGAAGDSPLWPLVSKGRLAGSRPTAWGKGGAYWAGEARNQVREDYRAKGHGEAPIC